jgi:hypothetical protein
MDLAQTRHRAPCKVTILLILPQKWQKLAREVNSNIASFISLPLARRGYHVGQRATSPCCFANSCFHVLQSEIYIVTCVRTQNIDGKIYVQTVNKKLASKSSTNQTDQMTSKQKHEATLDWKESSPAMKHGQNCSQNMIYKLLSETIS